MAIHFEKYAQEGNAFINELSEKLGYKEEKSTVGILLRAVLHTLRDSITIAESFHFMSQLPMFLKAVYVEHWTYNDEFVKLKIKTIEDFTKEVELDQANHGETRFGMKQSTEELVKIIFDSLGKYISEGEFNHIQSQYPLYVRELFSSHPKAA